MICAFKNCGCPRSSGVDGGLSLDLNGSAKEGASDYVKAEGKVGCGPISGGANATLDNCGDLKFCLEGSFKAGISSDVNLAIGGSVCKDYFSGDYSGSGLATGSEKTNFGTKIECKGSVGLKGGACYGTKLL